MLGATLAPASTTLTLSADPSGRINVGDLLTVDEFPSNRTWTAGTPYTLGQVVRPTTANTTGYYYTCATAGTSGATEPTWPTADSVTVNDNGILWSCHAGGENLGAVTAVAGPVITFTNATTITHVAGSKVFYTPVAMLQEAILPPAAAPQNTTLLTPNQIQLTAATINKVHVGDILILTGDPATVGCCRPRPSRISGAGDRPSTAR